MPKTKKIILGHLLLVVMTFNFFSTGFASVPYAEKEKQYENIQEEEQRVLEELLRLMTEIELLQTELERNELRLEAIEKEKLFLENEKVKQEEELEDMLVVFEKILRHQQRQGAGGTLSAFFNAGSLKQWMREVNTLRTFSKHSKTFIQKMESLIQDHEQNKKNLELLEESLKEEMAKEALILYEMKEKHELLASYLEEISDEKAFYHEQLKALEIIWTGLKPMFAETVVTFNQMIQNNELPEDTVSISLTGLTPTARLTDRRLNHELSKRKDLPEMIFSFRQDVVELSFPQHHIAFLGDVHLVGGKVIEIKMHSGTFYGLSLSEDALTDLFFDGDLIFDLSKMLGNNSIRTIQVKEGMIEMRVTIRLF